MSERGVFAMDRGWFKHEAFAEEPFTEREAWAWLIAAAAYRAHRRRVGSCVVDLDRGQLAASIRFLSERWQWHRSKVERFLKRLGAPDFAMIETAARQGIGVITICNYDKYQRSALPDGEQIETAARQQRDKVEVKEIKEDIDDVVVTPRASFSQEAVALADSLARIAGHDPGFLPPRWVSAGPVRYAQAMLDARWPAHEMLDLARATARRKRPGEISSIRYFEKVFADAFERRIEPTLPLPAVQIQKTETGSHRETPTSHPAVSDWRGRRDGQHAALAKLRAAVNAHTGPDRGGEGGGHPLRVVPHA